MTAHKFTKNPGRYSQLRGFTLVEMLTVMGIMAVLGVIMVPALQSLQKGSGFTSTVYNVSDLMNLARTYAVANDTYVYVGIEEVTRSVSTTVTPQTAGVGRVAVCILATNDGTSDTTATNLSVVRPVQLFDFLHLGTTTWNNPSTGNMARPDGTLPTKLTAFNLATPSALPIYYPLSATSTTTAKYTFKNVICFNPQGGVVISGTSPTAVQWLELDLQPISGNPTTVPAPTTATINSSNIAALVVEGATGSNTVYRP